MNNNSKQRRLILEIIQNTKSHPTASWIYERAREKMPNISLGTVYRNIDFLQKNGDIIKINSLDDSDRYDGCVKDHCHFQCKRCNTVYDVDEIDFANINSCSEKSLMCKIEETSVFFYGICRHCLENPEKI